MPRIVNRYLIKMWSLVEPNRYGPFKSEEEREVKMLELIRRSDYSGDDVFLSVEVYDDDTCDVDSYSGAYMDEMRAKAEATL